MYNLPCPRTLLIIDMTVVIFKIWGKKWTILSIAILVFKKKKTLHNFVLLTLYKLNSLRTGHVEATFYINYLNRSFYRLTHGSIVNQIPLFFLWTQIKPFKPLASTFSMNSCIYVPSDVTRLKYVRWSLKIFLRLIFNKSVH